MGQHQPQDGIDAQGQTDAAGGRCAQRCVGMGDERSYADHIGLKFAQEADVFHQVSYGLERRSDHHSGTGLIAKFPQCTQAGEPVFQPHFRRVKAGIKPGGSTFVPQQVTIGSAAP